MNRNMFRNKVWIETEVVERNKGKKTPSERFYTWSSTIGQFEVERIIITIIVVIIVNRSIKVNLLNCKIFTYTRTACYIRSHIYKYKCGHL